MAATDLSAGQAALIAQITDLMPQAEADLAALVRIPSINFPDFDPKPVHECATAVADLFEAAGASRVSLVPGSSGVPTVMAELDATPDAPTVMLYSHYDVQPAGDSTIWESAAFEPIVRDGRTDVRPRRCRRQIWRRHPPHLCSGTSSQPTSQSADHDRGGRRARRRFRRVAGNPASGLCRA